MAYDPDIHHRRSIRLPGYDYGSPGWYFVTICVQNKQHVFGEVAEGEVGLNEAGTIVERAWWNLRERFPGVVVDEHVVMPNHFHGIMQIVGAGLAPPGSGTPRRAPGTKGDASIAPTRGRVPTLADLVRVFKSTAAIAVNALLLRQGNPLWQRDYYEHVIRNERELAMIRDYIRTNPQRWTSDPENPAVTRPEPEPWL